MKSSQSDIKDIKKALLLHIFRVDDMFITSIRLRLINSIYYGINKQTLYYTKDNDYINCRTAKLFHLSSDGLHHYTNRVRNVHALIPESCVSLSGGGPVGNIVNGLYCFPVL